jgi:hypothetical protein
LGGSCTLRDRGNSDITDKRESWQPVEQIRPGNPSLPLAQLRTSIAAKGCRMQETTSRIAQLRVYRKFTENNPENFNMFPENQSENASERQKRHPHCGVAPCLSLNCDLVRLGHWPPKI